MYSIPIIIDVSLTYFKLGRENVDILEKIFGVFYNCGLTLGTFLRQHEAIHDNEELQLILGNCYADLLRLVTGINLFYTRKQSSTHRFCFLIFILLTISRRKSQYSNLHRALYQEY